MTSKAKRAQYTLEFKLEAVRLVKAGQSMAAVAATLGVVEQTLYNWVKAALRITGVIAKEAVLLVGLPAAVITTVFAEEHGVFEAEFATIVLASRLLSFISLPIMIAVTNHMLAA